MKSRTEILVPIAAIQAVPIAVIAWYRLHRYAWYRYSAIVNKWSRWISDSKSVVLRRNGKLICRAIPNTAFADQIASRHYADAYAASSKPVISLALEFDRQSRGLIDWKKL